MNGTNGTAHGEEQAVSLPSAKSFSPYTNVTIQPPLTRHGSGPALLLLLPNDIDLRTSSKTLDPPPLQKWAEEGFAVAEIRLGSDDEESFLVYLDEALQALTKMDSCTSIEQTGLICRYL